jgi:hypothetical protein
MSIYNRFYAVDDYEDLRSPSALPVPQVVHVTSDDMQGDDLGHGIGIIIQFYSGSGNDHFVCLLTFEDWGSERCPRFTWYQRDRDAGDGVYVQCTNPSGRFTLEEIR